MKSQFNSYKTLNYCLLLLILCAQESQAMVTDSQVANWKGNKTAVFLLMFDDSFNSAYQVAIPELLKRNMIATFYVNPGGNKWANPAVEGPNQWENLIPKTGMVYGDHTWTHNGAADLVTEDREILLCQEKILSLFYSDNKPHLISYGQPGVDVWFSYGAELTAILAKYNLIDRPTFVNHGAVYHLQTIDQMLALADKAIERKGMEYLIIHGVERRASEGDPNWGYQDFWALNKDIFRGVLDGLVTRRENGNLWITDHISQYKYQMERDNMPTFQVQQSNDQLIQLTMTGTLDTGLYDMPLTVITQVPATWSSIVITQGTQTSLVPVVNGAIQYDALPNGTLITLTKNSDNQAPTVPISLVSSSISQIQFTLSWIASTDNVGVAGYDVYQGGVLKGNTTSTSFSVTGLTAGTTYAFTIKAKDLAGNISASSSVLNVTTLAVEVPLLNIALNKTVTASSSPTLAANCTDGIFTSYWAASTGNKNEWIQVDLGSLYNITGAEIMWKNPSWSFKYKIEVSNDNSTWVMASDQTANTISFVTETVSFTSNGYRYIRLTVTGWGNSGYWTGLYEFRVFGALLTDLSKEIQNSEVKIYPNPASEYLSVENVKLNAEVTISTSNGIIVYNKRTIKSGNLTLSTNNWAKGVCLVRIKDDTGIAMKKVLVQ